MRALPTLLLLLLPACYVGPKYKIANKKKACATEFVERELDLAVKVDRGPGDGTFSYPMPEWALVAQTEGEYDLKTGQFWWSNDYAADAVRISERAEGTGSIQRNGDMDLDYVLTAAWKDGGTAQWAYRHKRIGCDETIRRESLEDPDDLELTDVSWVGGGADWSRNFVEGPVEVVGTGRLEADRSWTESVDFQDGGVAVVWFTEGDGNGHQTRTFNDDDGVSKSIGTWERWFDGTVAMNFTYNRSDILRQTWEFSMDSAGSGGGVWSTSEDECEISFNNGKCRLKNCTLASLEGQCTVPVTWPHF